MLNNDAQVKENIKIYKEELLKSKEKLVQDEQEYLEAKQNLSLGKRKSCFKLF